MNGKSGKSCGAWYPVTRNSTPASGSHLKTLLALVGLSLIIMWSPMLGFSSSSVSSPKQLSHGVSSAISIPRCLQRSIPSPLFAFRPAVIFLWTTGASCRTSLTLRMAALGTGLGGKG